MQNNTLPKPFNTRRFDKTQIDIIMKKIESYVTLERDRKIELLKKNEDEMLKLAETINCEDPKAWLNNQNMLGDLKMLASRNCNIIKWVTGANLV